MPRFMVTKKLKSSDPDHERWTEVVEEVDGIEVIQYTRVGMIVDHLDEAQLHVAVSSVADIKRM